MNQILLPKDPETLTYRIENALKLIETYSLNGVSGYDQIVRILTGPEYEQWVKNFNEKTNNK